MKDFLRRYVAGGAVIFALAVSGHAVAADESTPQPAGLQPTLEELKSQLGQVSAMLAAARAPAEIRLYSQRQADFIAHIVNGSPPRDQAAWVRQMAECLVLAAANSPAGDTVALDRLRLLANEVARARPGGELAAAITFCQMQARFAAQRRDQGADAAEVQKERREGLRRFIEEYAHAVDTPAAILELALLNESVGEKAEARTWYRRLAEQCRGSDLADKAKGALRRLDAPGGYVFLTAPLLESASDSSPDSFDLVKHRGKVVVLYFWLARSQRCQAEFRDLQRLIDRYSGAGLEVVTVSLDPAPAEARHVLQASSIDAVNLHQPGGFDGPFTTRYGVMAVPMIFLIGRGGLLVEENIPLVNLEAAVIRELARKP
jgi:hypothetical protein